MPRDALIAKAERTLRNRATSFPADAGQQWSQLPEDTRSALISGAATAAVDMILDELGISTQTPTTGTPVGPRRLKREVTKGWRKPTGSIIVDRSTRWGNPFLVGHSIPGIRRRNHQLFTVRDEADAVELYEEWQSGVITLPDIPRWNRPPSDDQIRRQLAGADLICWCPLTDGDGGGGRPTPCHADVLLSIANSTTSRKAK
ncbi:DUF4326 domain-containing protein [Prescottella agglutinans]|uniref:DUF4326 domain-containing protein n=1 Tax=Prescottella agglutinans TaxID=1644129 RepID=A0ABT6M986_9NOCA|nr:DUF4326 domain-containing protein [Prescottella agglutinans]MDH6280877.1 hypothetical protein [Prescottella agglutinans]